MSYKTFDWAPEPTVGTPRLPLSSNLLLRQLTDSERMAVERESELQPVVAGTTLFEAGELLDHVYFPVDTIVSLEQSCGVEVSVAGREGMAGWTAMAGFRNSPYRATVRCYDGQLLKLPMDSWLSLCASNTRLWLVLHQYLIVTAVQMAEGLGARSHLRLEAAIARWLLMRHDRVGGDWIKVQHQEIADSLGARRASVTDCLHILEGDQQIRGRRGRILIRSRGDLKARSNGAYGAAESIYRASLGAFGKACS